MRLSLSILFLLGLAGATGASANPEQETTLTPPGMGVATDDGSDSIPINPALFAFDPDAGASLLGRYEPSNGSLVLQNYFSTRGMGLGMFYRASAESDTLWALSTSFAFKLSPQLVAGSSIRWNLPQGSDNNFTSWDLGLGWRPLAWLGFGAAFTDIGSPSPEFGATGQYAFGVALRPWGDFVSAGLDLLASDDTTSTGGYTDRAARLVLQASPIPGLLLRFQATEGIESSSQSQRLQEIAGGIQLSFGKWAGGFYADSPLASEVAYTGSITSVFPSTHLAGTGKRVPVLHVDSDLPYSPQPTLLGRQEESYLHFLQRLQVTATDPSVKAVLLHLDKMSLSVGQVEELRDLVAEIRDHGRSVIVYLDSEAGNLAYMLATSADRIYLHPAADLNLIGFAAEVKYFKGTLDLLGLKPQFFVRSEYKSAVESFTRSTPSAPASEQINTLLEDIHAALIRAISKGRGLSHEQVGRLLDSGPWTASEALSMGLVDGLIYEDQLEETIEGYLQSACELDDRFRSGTAHDGWKSPKRIAVIPITGAIVEGTSSGRALPGMRNNTYSRTIVKALKQVRKDNTVKAVILRVDSPGGSAFASDDIWQAVSLVRESGKPVVVSMGGVAASGGYYVATAASHVLAEPSTITGSIGVFGGKISAKKLYEQIGVSTTQFTRSQKSGMWTISRPFDRLESASVDRLIGDTYTQFKQRVATGRSMDMEEVEEIARGRVWSGTRAMDAGLVDEIGGLSTAVERARIEAGIAEHSRYDLITYSLAPGSNGDLPTRLLLTLTGSWTAPTWLSQLLAWSDLQNERILFLLPYDLEIH